MAKVKIFCRAYNVKPYIEQCISSVLSQTYSDFEFFLIDNGCTDGSSEIIDAFAADDSRIHVIRFEKNTSVADSLYRIVQQTAEGYVAIIDSDDWWEPNYLERLLNFAERNGLDIACTGAYMQQDHAEEVYARELDRPIILERSQFDVFFRMYHVFFRTYWGKLFRAEVLPKSGSRRFACYGGDTLYAFEALQNSARMGIDSGSLYHYRIHGSSVSYHYYPQRFVADVYLYEEALRFLSAYGMISPENRSFLKVVFENAVLDTLYTLCNSKLSPGEKSKEFRKVIEHPLVRGLYQAEPEGGQRRGEAALLAFNVAKLVEKNSFEDIQVVIQILLPDCGSCVTGENLSLFSQEPPLAEALLNDNRNMLAARLLTLIRTKRLIKRYNIAGMLQALAKEIPLLSQVDNAGFIRKYPNIYQALWHGQTAEALDEMTGLLLENQVSSAKETFLQLYLGAAALLEEVPAFIFGKIRLAELYLLQGRGDECRTILNDLEEMGIEEDEEIAGIKRRLAVL